MLKINQLLIQFIHTILINQCENTNNNIYNLGKKNLNNIVYCRIYKLEAI